MGEVVSFKERADKKKFQKILDAVAESVAQHGGTDETEEQEQLNQAMDDFYETIEKNAENAARVAEERKKNNLSTLNSYRIKPTPRK
jgi:predicted lipoprotein